jgi:hypothetical protein
MKLYGNSLEYSSSSSLANDLIAECSSRRNEDLSISSVEDMCARHQWR